MSPRPTTSTRPQSSPTCSSWTRRRSSPTKSLLWTPTTMTLRSKTCSIKYIECKPVTLYVKTCLSVCRCRRQCPIEQGDLLEIDRGNRVSTETPISTRSRRRATRAYLLLRAQTMGGTKFIFYMVELAWHLVVFFKIRKSSFADDFHEFILFCYSYIVYSCRRSTVTDGVYKDNTSKGPFSQCEQLQGITRNSHTGEKRIRGNTDDD